MQSRTIERISFIKIDFNSLLTKKRLTLPLLATKTGIDYNLLYRGYKRGAIKSTLLGKIEQSLNCDLSEFIIHKEEAAA